MEPIFKHTNPSSSIELIQIFPAVYDEGGSIHYTVLVDDLTFTFHLDETANWVYKEPFILADEIRWLIGDLIEKNHL